MRRKAATLAGRIAARLATEPEYAGAGDNRSASDNGDYVRFVRSALADYAVFKDFKRHPSYRAILEHVSPEEGRRYLDILRAEAPDLFGRCDEFKVNDLVGNPLRHAYPEVGEISPTTLRYMKVAADLRRLFGTDGITEVAEIGVGYGGQLLINDRVFGPRHHHLFDLAPVLELASRCLEGHVLRGSYQGQTLNRCPGRAGYDLVISNYAFSELPSALQREYVRKVLAKSARGYLTMNSGRPGTPFTGDYLSLEELRRLLPAFEVVDETPAPQWPNYVIIWGHR